MINNKITLICLLLITTTTLFAQNYSIAKGYYTKARETFEKNNFTATIDYLTKAKNEINTTNPDIMYYEILSLFAIDIKDERINTLGLKFLEEVSNADSRTKTISKKVIEHKEAVLAYRKKEEEAFNKIAKEKKQDLIDSFLNDYPSSIRKAEVLKMSKQFEAEKYANAIKLDDYKTYKLFLIEYPKTSKKEEITRLKAQAYELKRYNEVTKSPRLSPKYMSEFPKGKHTEEVKENYENYLFNKGNSYFSNKDYANAKNTYNTYLKNFERNQNASQAKKNVQIIEAYEQKNARIKARKSVNYIMPTYITNESFGIQLGKLHMKKLGVYFNLSANKNVFELEFNEDEAIKTSDFEVFSESENFDKANISSVFGLTYKVIYPLWINLGGGASYNEYFVADDSADITQKVTFEEKENLNFFPEIGLTVKLGNIISINGTALFIDGETYYKVGLGFTTNKW